ncbi:MAG: ATP-binding protein [Candidatus Cyclobacteriaceae bacterium M2_1C_046]
MVELLEVSQKLIRKVPLDFRRYLYDQVSWGSRLIGIKGARGTGKTTMLLQYLKNQNLSTHEAAYFTLDDLYFTRNTLLDVAKSFYQEGGKILVLDEVHKYPEWAREIKNLYDRYDDLQIIFTGSSIIDITKKEVDLSRRAVIYELQGLSYREYLNFKYRMDLPAFLLNEILDPTFKADGVFPPDFKPLVWFKEYLRYGYYPFYHKEKETYHLKLRQLARQIVEYDMAELRGFDIRNAKKMLQLVYLIAQLVPFKPNISSLAEKTGIHRNSMLNYLHFLNEARLIDLLFSKTSGVALLQKPEKVYMENPNMMYAMAEDEPSTGTVREVFFNNQLKIRHLIQYSDKVDFLIDGKHHFEIGGKSKGKSQIKNLADAWVVKDDLEFPVGDRLPLWIFGFLY